MRDTEVKIFQKPKSISFCSARIPLTKDQEIIEPDWEVYLRKTARMIGEQQTPQRYA